MNRSAQGARSTLLGYGFITASSLLFGLAGTLAKMLFVADLPPLVMVAVRSFIAAAAMLAVMPLLGRPLRLRRADLPFLLWMGVLLTLVNVTFFYAIALTNVAIALMLEYTAPLVIVFAGVLLGRRRLTRPVLLVLAGNVAGCFLLVGGYDSGLWSGNALGVAMGLLCAVCFAAYNVYGARGHVRGLDSWGMTAWPFLVSALFWGAASPLIDYSTVELSWQVAGFTLFIGIFGTVVPYGLYLEGLKHVDPFPATVIGMLDPVFAGLTAYLLLGERFELPQAAGMALVCVVIVFVGRADSPAPKREAEGEAALHTAR